MRRKREQQFAADRGENNDSSAAIKVLAHRQRKLGGGKIRGDSMPSLGAPTGSRDSGERKRETERERERDRRRKREREEESNRMSSAKVRRTARNPAVQRSNHHAHGELSVQDVQKPVLPAKAGPTVRGD